jgi:hypothetical protein
VLAVAKEATPPNARGSVRVAVSVSTFTPKAQTPFQWEAQIPLDEVLRRQALLREAVPRKGVELHWHDSDVSFLEGVMARGGRELSGVIEAAWRAGARFDAWSECFRLSTWLEAFAEKGVDPAMVANRERPTDEPLPWDHLSAGVDKRYLVAERQCAMDATVTPDCSFSGCTGCEVCGDLGVDIRLAGGSRG